MKPQQAYTLKQTADLLSCSMPSIYRMITKKKLKTFRVNADQRVTASEIARIQEGE